MPEGTIDQLISMRNTMKAQLIKDLHRCEAVKFDNFLLKSGITSPIYLDIRVSVSHPKLLTLIAEAVEVEMKIKSLECDHLCGVPYTALPIATCISTKTQRPMLIRRKETKAYGTKKHIEGNYRAGDSVLIIEDIVTSGSSILETVKVLENVGLKVTDAIVLIDRGQGGKEFLRDRGIRLHPVLNLTEVIDELEQKSLITKDKAEETRKFLKNVRPECTLLSNITRKTFKDRAAVTCQAVGKKLFEICHAKNTNLCVAIDVTKCSELLSISEQIGPYVCAVKTHIDALDDFKYDEVIPKLKALAAKFNFLLFEDRKFADIGKTVQLQFSAGLYKISEWADLVTVHGIPGEGVINGLKSVLKNSETACVIVAEMSSKGSLTTEQYRKSCATMAEDHPDFVIGLVSQSRQMQDTSGKFVQMTPGVQLGQQGDTLGQQYVTPEVAIRERGADIIIVGRGITANENPGATAKVYAELGWSVYQSVTE